MNREHAVYGFVQRKVSQLDEDSLWSRAMLAKLRRGIGKSPGAVPDIWDITLAGAPNEWQSDQYGAPSYAELAVHTALTLYALHRQGKQKSMSVIGKQEEEGRKVLYSFGYATACLIMPDKSNFEAVKRRFDAVATSIDFAELARHARGIIQLLKAKDIPMDYPHFARDLYVFQFDGQDDRIRLRWGEDFYCVFNKETGKDADNE